ncbi:MAG: hypothetical protein AAGB16_03605 [Pseudomonadota bacterium]
MRFGLVLCFALLAAGIGEAEEREWPKFGVMSLADYQAYFTPGTYRTYNIEFDSYGSETISEINFASDEEVPVMNWQASALYVSDNLIPSIQQPYIKTVTPAYVFAPKWDESRKRFYYEVTQSGLQEGLTGDTVWLSEDKDVTVSPGDVSFGNEDVYYDRAEQETNGACCYSDEEFEQIHIGEHSLNCGFVAHPSWDVLCYFRSPGNASVDRVYYKRMDFAIG